MNKQDTPARKELPADAEPIVSPEVLEKLPPEAKQEIIKLSAFMGSFASPGHSPILKKINEEHISKILDFSENDSKRVYQDAQTTKRYNLAYALLFCAVAVFLVIYLSDKNPELLKEILKLLIAFLGGLGAGYGLKRSKNKDD